MHTINSVKYYYKITLLKDPWSPTLSWSTTLLPHPYSPFLSFPSITHKNSLSTARLSASQTLLRTASRPPNAWLLTLPSLQTRHYVQDIIFLYKIVSGLVDSPDLLDKIVFHVIKSLVFLIVVRFKWLQTVISCCDSNQSCPYVSLCQQIAALKNTNTALKQWNNTVLCILIEQDSANSFMKQIKMIVSTFLLCNF